MKTRTSRHIEHVRYQLMTGLDKCVKGSVRYVIKHVNESDIWHEVI